MLKFTLLSNGTGRYTRIGGVTIEDLERIELAFENIRNQFLKDLQLRQKTDLGLKEVTENKKKETTENLKVNLALKGKPIPNEE